MSLKKVKEANEVELGEIESLFESYKKELLELKREKGGKRGQARNKTRNIRNKKHWLKFPGLSIIIADHRNIGDSYHGRYQNQQRPIASPLTGPHKN